MRRRNHTTEPTQISSGSTGSFSTGNIGLSLTHLSVGNGNAVAIASFSQWWALLGVRFTLLVQRTGSLDVGISRN
jgi:hypothetical protein